MPKKIIIAMIFLRAACLIAMWGAVPTDLSRYHPTIKKYPHLVKHVQQNIIKNTVYFIIHGPYNCLKHEKNGYARIWPSICDDFFTNNHDAYYISYYDKNWNCIELETDFLLKPSSVHATPASDLCRYAESRLDPAMKRRAERAKIFYDANYQKTIAFYDNQHRIIFHEPYKGRAEFKPSERAYFENFIILDQDMSVKDRTYYECSLF